MADSARSLIVDGLVHHAKTYTFEDLTGLELQIPDISIVAPGREGAAVPLAALCAQAIPCPMARYITLEADDFSVSVEWVTILDHALLVYRIGNSPLPSSQGGPIRFLIPNPAACGPADVDACANVKYVHRMTFSLDPGVDSRSERKRQQMKLNASGL